MGKRGAGKTFREREWGRERGLKGEDRGVGEGGTDSKRGGVEEVNEEGAGENMDGEGGKGGKSRAL